MNNAPDADCASGGFADRGPVYHAPVYAVVYLTRSGLAGRRWRSASVRRQQVIGRHAGCFDQFNRAVRSGSHPFRQKLSRRPGRRHCELPFPGLDLLFGIRCIRRSHTLATMQAPLATTAAAIMRPPRTAHIIWEMTLDLTDEKAALPMLMLLRQTVERSPEPLRLRARCTQKLGKNRRTEPNPVERS